MAIDDLEQITLLLIGAAEGSVFPYFQQRPEWSECGLSGQEALRMHRWWRQITCFLQQASPVFVHRHALELLRSVLGFSG